MTTYIHLGVMTNNHTPTPPDFLERVFPTSVAQKGGYTFHARHTNAGKFDSFSQWCEPLDAEHAAGDPVHVIVNIPDEDVRDVARIEQRAVVLDVMRTLDRLVEGTTDEPVRLCDYVVLTDSDDWTERVEIVGRFA